MRVRVRARARVTGTPPARASRAAAAAPQLRPRPGPARPRARSPAAPHGAVSHRRAGVRRREHPEEARAEGEAARGRLPGPLWSPLLSPALSPPRWRRGRKWSGGGGWAGSPALPDSYTQPVPQFPPPPCRKSRIKVVAPGCWGQLSPPELEVRIGL